MREVRRCRPGETGVIKQRCVRRRYVRRNASTVACEPDPKGPGSGVRRDGRATPYRKPPTRSIRSSQCTKSMRNCSAATLCTPATLYELLSLSRFSSLLPLVICLAGSGRSSTSLAPDAPEASTPFKIDLTTQAPQPSALQPPTVRRGKLKSP